MQLQRASRGNVKIKLGLQGPSGSGKTYSSLLLAYGLCGDWSKITVIDSENRSSELYDHLGPFQLLPLNQPYSPERYIEAIQVCQKAGAEVIIIDSISHEWEAEGGILNLHSQMQGNSFMNWNKLTPRHNALIHCILQSPVHVICTIRSKQGYVITEKNGKQVPEKVGMRGITREGLDYELTTVFVLDMTATASCSKDRTFLFNGKPGIVITADTGKAIANWCNPSIALSEDQIKSVNQRINACKSLAELLELYNSVPGAKEQFEQEFKKKKAEFVADKKLTNQQNFSTNGSIKN